MKKLSDVRISAYLAITCKNVVDRCLSPAQYYFPSRLFEQTGNLSPERPTLVSSGLVPFQLFNIACTPRHPIVYTAVVGAGIFKSDRSNLRSNLRIIAITPESELPRQRSADN